ncbi:hypothetical protein AX15_001052 [Amanita polypyramis BW_CC]|nr:hypothetical protein AX15_001052 [Amanita polypyramis BW_CC]
MNEEEAISLLLKSAMPASLSDETKALARTIVSAVGYIPLAIDQAGAYIHVTDCDLKGYLDLHNQYHSQLMLNATFKGASDYGYSTYGTWEISMKEIERRASIGTGPEAFAAQSAITLHKVFAFLHHVSISEEIFSKAAENYIKRNVKEEERLGFPLSVSLLDSQFLFLKEGKWNRVQFLAGIQVLTSFSLVKSSNKFYSLHPLVQAWGRDRIPNEDINTICGITRAILACSIDCDEYGDNYAYCGALVPHIRENDMHVAQLEIKDMQHIDECDRFSYVFRRVAEWSDCEKLYICMMEMRKAKLGEDHPDTLTAMNNLAMIYLDQGRYNEAKKLQVYVMEARKAKLGEDHPDTLTTMNNLAMIYMNQGRLGEAEKLHVHVMEARKAKLGDDHPDILNTMNNLASTYMNQGRLGEAEKLLVHVTEARKAKLGEDHPDTLASMSNLGLTYTVQGRWDEAEKLQMHDVEVGRAKFGEYHPDTLVSMNNLALTYSNQGRLDEAEKLHVHIMEAMKAKLGEDHPNTLANMNNLALIYLGQGKLDEAEKLQVHVMEARKAKLGEHHPDTLISMNNLASTYMNQGRFDEALELHVMRAKKAMANADTLDRIDKKDVIHKEQGEADDPSVLLIEIIIEQSAEPKNAVQEMQEHSQQTDLEVPAALVDYINLVLKTGTNGSPNQSYPLE